MKEWKPWDEIWTWLSLLDKSPDPYQLKIWKPPPSGFGRDGSSCWDRTPPLVFYDGKKCPPMNINMWRQSLDPFFQREEKPKTKQQKELFQPLSWMLCMRESNSSLLQQKHSHSGRLLKFAPELTDPGRPGGPVYLLSPKLAAYTSMVRGEWQNDASLSTPGQVC